MGYACIKCFKEFTDHDKRDVSCIKVNGHCMDCTASSPTLKQSLKDYDIKIVKQKELDERRLEIAKCLLAGMLSNSGQYQMHTKEKMVAEAIELTDSLLEALKDVK